MMRVYKASAGSGKTYTLANSYVQLLLDALKDDPKAYRSILAVTFTNKATAEMKERILKYLSEKASSNPDVRDILISILHDYSAFSISTIDRFFQQALRAFSRELGQGAAYQIELDRDSLINEAMDRILDNLTDKDAPLLDWFSDNMADRLETGERFNMEDGLYEMGKYLSSLESRPSYDPATLKELRKACKEITSAFHVKVSAEAKAALPKVSDRVAKWLGKYVDPKPSASLERPNATTMKATADTPFADIWESDEFRSYNTARVVEKLIFTLGFAREFYERFDSLLKEKNVLCLDESNSILKGIIDGSDAPFIYEKLGVRYNHFLLDEFQDTSIIQWENFLPLVREAESNGNPDQLSNLIVGDVKQSIYRWRNSDWTLLERRVPQEFPSAVIEPLETNWRSAQKIIEFNNGFFAYAAAALGKADIYADVSQKAHSSESGQVKVSFTDDQCAAVIDSVRSALGHGAGYGDIAIIVRGHLQGGRIADALIAEGIPVVSDDSLRLTSSLTVRRILSLLRTMDSPEDSLGAFITADLGIALPENYHSLVDLCEGFAGALAERDPSLFAGEILYVQTFMDDVQNWTSTYGNNLKYYLQHFDSKELYVGSPESTACVRIITIHKSKGLEFPFVIFPFADDVKSTIPESRWCHLSASACKLPAVFDNVYPVKLTKNVADTWFAADYQDNCSMQVVDNLNLFYVCCTRAEKQLHIISGAKPTEGSLAALLYSYVGEYSEWNNGEDYDFSALHQDAPGDASADASAAVFPASYDYFPKNPCEDHLRFEPSTEAQDFFGEDGVSAREQDKENGVALHAILSQVVVPSDLQAAVSDAVSQGLLALEDAPRVSSLLSKRIAAHPSWFGDLASGREPSLTGSSPCVFNERSIISADGAFLRPDRVILGADGTVTVIDFKFGAPRAAYFDQVRAYMSLYRALGYACVRGYLWFVYQDRVEEVV